jgi:hypothetical protein
MVNVCMATIRWSRINASTGMLDEPQMNDISDIVDNPHPMMRR